MSLAWCPGVRIVEARFHRGSAPEENHVLVARVLCYGTHVRFEWVPIRADAVEPREPVELLDELEYLVGSVVGDMFKELLELRNPSWSFVPVPDRGDHAQRLGITRQTLAKKIGSSEDA